MFELRQMEHTCNFCKKVFSKESSLISHVCTYKQRWLQKDEKPIKAAQLAWEQFYKRANPGSKKKVGYEEFMKSKYYNHFVKFGYFLNREEVLQPEKFLDFLIKNCVKLQDWTKESTYESFIKEYLNREDPVNAVIRSFKFINAWAESNAEAPEKFFENVSTNLAVQALRSGTVSPWIIFCSTNGTKLIRRFDAAQFKLLGDFFNEAAWKIRIKRHAKDVEEISSILKEASL